MEQPINPVAEMLDNLRIPQGTKREDLFATFIRRSARFSSQAITEAANRFLDGDVGNGKFAPTVAEFLGECKDRQDLIDIRKRPDQKSVFRNTGPCPFDVNQERLKTENRNRPVLFENVNLDKWQQLSKNKQIPPGSVWQAALGTVFGPVPEDVLKQVE